MSISVKVFKFLQCVLKFFKITGKTCGKICIYLLRVHFKKKDQQRTYLMMFMGFFFFMIFFKKD